MKLLKLLNHDLTVQLLHKNHEKSFSYKIKPKKSLS